MLTVHIRYSAVPQLVKDCKANGIEYKLLTRGTLRIADTPKGRTALQMVRMNYGLQSLKITTHI